MCIHTRTKIHACIQSLLIYYSIIILDNQLSLLIFENKILWNQR